MQSTDYNFKLVESAIGGKRLLVHVRNTGRLFSISALGAFWATALMAQSTAPAAKVHLNSPVQYRASNSTLGVTGLPTGPNRVPYPLTSTPANDAWVRNNAWAAYNANLHQIPTTTNPNRLAPRQNLLDQDRFIQRPNSTHRYNFQFSDNEIRSVQAALRRMGTYSGQVDGILGPDTQRAIEEYQVRTKRPVTGQPDQSLNASLGIF
jgi:Putative peptidoglycan binding domain